jgi:hypothetical protein
MTIALEKVARTLQMSPEQLLRESLRAYISREKRLAEMDIADIKDRYRATSPQELAKRIKAGEIYSHPAWEDLIEWENLLAHIERLDQLGGSVSCCGIA